MAERHRVLTRQLVVRLDETLYQALERDAQDNGRTVAQTVRFKLRQSLGVS